MQAKLQKISSDSEFLKYQALNRKMYETKMMRDIPRLKTELLFWKQKTAHAKKREAHLEEMFKQHQKNMAAIIEKAEGDLKAHPEWQAFERLSRQRSQLQSEVETVAADLDVATDSLETVDLNRGQLEAQIQSVGQSIASCQVSLRGLAEEQQRLALVLQSSPRVDIAEMEREIGMLEQRLAELRGVPGPT
ncbi:chromosome segregation protein [Carpediemonas membranifera]|uniref:Chromosome segregation protein n=1 Tax=Carpediemonas membranifera TaxID=201153 RepID=A0A8J6B1P2_9EUKA|nr:chromosome segregation protein [Carpediemonas membranifera]|eukprot:KAG9392389.1 chromosome segregation protein [Carpediemonas membranifera]